MPADADALLAVHRRSVLQLGRGAYTQAECESWAAGLTPQHYVTAMSVKREVYRVACRGGDVAGSCSFKGTEIIGLYVDPSAARCGVGSALIRAAEHEIVGAHRVTDGPLTLRLTAALSAVAFYTAHGYRAGDAQDWTTRGGRVLRVHAMQKSLA